MSRTILIVDDNAINRHILGNTLKKDYTVLEADCGEAALELLHQRNGEISAMLLDIVMPVMNGYEVIRRMRADDDLDQIPVIMVTGSEDEESRVKAITVGANDFIVKPYNPDVILHCLNNNIALYETMKTVTSLQRDKLTGLYSREAFFEKVQEMVSSHEPGYYIMACFDVDHFKVINDQYGTEKGDKILRHIADSFKNGFNANGGIVCRIAADDFAVLYPAAFARLSEIEDIRHKASNAPGLVSPIVFSIGRYVVDDLSLSPSGMYDRAMLAMNSIKGRYDVQVAAYDEILRQNLLNEQSIVNEMRTAIDERQFEVWYQPQYNHSTGALIGAEALVRWRHPERGLISPGLFIPVFEKNGFIYELDKYVWEDVCRFLRLGIDKGFYPLPVSVNISRYDIFCPDIVDVITGLVKKYDLPTDLLRLEITESAFAESTKKIVSVVKQLIACGFTLEIDDFGSGYSSLNTLKSVPAQIVKLDMRFFENDDGTGRSGNIIESVVRMVSWLGMSVIAEGVESHAHADFLGSIGCDYIQGYLYSEPIPEVAYIALAKGNHTGEKLLKVEAVETLDHSEFWNPKSMDTLIFNSYVGGAFIFEFQNQKMKLLRVNDRYIEELGDGSTKTEIFARQPLDYMDEANKRRMVEGICRAVESGKEISFETSSKRPNNPTEMLYIRTTLRVIARAGNRYLLYGVILNMTEQRESERKQQILGDQINAIMESVNGGISAMTLDENLKPTLLFANDEYYRLLGYTKEQYDEEVDSIFNVIVEEDRPAARHAVEKILEDGIVGYNDYRCVKRDGSITHIRANKSLVKIEGYGECVIISVITDISELVQAKLRAKQAEASAATQIQAMMDDVPGGIAYLRLSPDGSIRPDYVNKDFCAFAGMHLDEAMRVYGENFLAGVHPDDRELLSAALAAAIEGKRDAVYILRLICGTGEYRPFHVTGRITPNGTDTYSVCLLLTPIGRNEPALAEALSYVLSAIMESSVDLAFAKDTSFRYLSASRAFMEMAGVKKECDIIGKTDFDIFPEALAAKFRKDDEALLREGKPLIEKIEEIPSEDDTVHYSQTSKFILRDTMGNAIGIFGRGRDITQSLATESQLKLLTDNIPGAIATYEGRPDALDKIRLSYLNNGFLRLFGYSREEYEKRAAVNPFGLVFKEYLPGMMSQVHALITENKPMDYIYRAETGDGGHKWINMKGILGPKHGDNLTLNAILFDVTEQFEAVERIRISEEEYRLAMEHSSRMICRYDIGTHTITFPDSMVEKYHAPKNLQNVPDVLIKSGAISPDTADAYAAFYEGMARGDKECTVLFKKKVADEWRWISGQATTVFDNSGKPYSAIISYEDVTDQLQMESVYRKWKQSLRNRKENTYTLYQTNLCKNDGFCTKEGSLLDYAPAKDDTRSFNSRTADFAEQYVCDEDKQQYITFADSQALIDDYYRGDRISSIEFRAHFPDGDVRWLRLTAECVLHQNSGDVEVYMLFEDINESKLDEIRLHLEAENDPLTGLLNRRAFSEKMGCILSHRNTKSLYALLLLDLDGFKLVNDRLGHAVGDQVLIDVGASIRSMLRDEDILCRMGGDEYLVLLCDMPDRASIAEKAKQLIALTHKSFDLDVRVSISVGIVVCPDDGASFDELYLKVDKALYFVKENGKNNFVFYDEHMALTDKMVQNPVKPEKAQRKMLIADSDETDCAALAEIFKDDFAVGIVHSGNEVLTYARQYREDLSVILLDMTIPGMDGFEVLKKLRCMEGMELIPVIVLSDMEDRDKVVKAIKARAYDFVYKPVDADLLRVRVESAINRADNERLRIQSAYLALQGSELRNYRAALKSVGTSLVECRKRDGRFVYEPTISSFIQGTFDDRGLMEILTHDNILGKQDAAALLGLLASGSGEMRLRLQAQDGTAHTFSVIAVRCDETDITENATLLLFTDLGMHNRAEKQ